VRIVIIGSRKSITTVRFCTTGRSMSWLMFIGGGPPACPIWPICMLARTKYCSMTI
jgi:hypothetical protein